VPDHTNELGQPIGEALPDWQPRPLPPRTPMPGRLVTLEPLNLDLHCVDLFDAFALDIDDRNWTYLPHGPFGEIDVFRTWMTANCFGDDPLFHAIVDTSSGRALGIASYQRIEPDVGSIEVGYINFSPALQRTALATEAMFLMMQRAFDELGYRRYEWKCDALNAASQAAAQRLGFTYEGTFRQAIIYKGRSRDTAWFSITDVEWQTKKIEFKRWLDPANFEPNGTQHTALRQNK
jgi:RimJ/RimL family protein N-acetyltransferase